MTLQEITTKASEGLRTKVRKYPIMDSDTGLAIPNLVGKYFEIEIDYRFYEFHGKRQILPISKYVKILTFWDTEKRITEEYAKRILRTYLISNEDMIPKLEFLLEELLLGNEGDQEIHTLKAKGRAYCLE
jgi:hypothetical protein